MNSVHVNANVGAHVNVKCSNQYTCFDQQSYFCTGISLTELFPSGLQCLCYCGRAKEVLFNTV